MVSVKKTIIVSLAATLLFLAAIPRVDAEPVLHSLSGYVPAVVSQLVPQGVVPATNRLQLAIGLPLHNRPQLNELIAQLYDVRSTNYHRFLTPQEFTARFGPTVQDYQAVIEFAEAHGLKVVGRHSNRVVVDVAGSAADIGQAFQITLRTYKHPTEPRNFFAPDTEPFVPTNLPLADIWGLSDYALPRPQLVKVAALKTRPLNYNGSGLDGSYRGADFRNAYLPGSSLNGTGQTVALMELDGYYANDISSYETQCGYPNVPLQNVLLDGVSGTPGYSGEAYAVTEVSLDIEMAVAMAPGLTRIVVYEGNSPYDVFSSIATDDTAKQVSSSWSFDTGYRTQWAGRNSTLDDIFTEMISQGQDVFQAVGDSDAYTGSQSLTRNGGPIPVDSVYVTSVGGTSLTMNGTGASWSSETTWNWGGNEGTGGGVSPNYMIPSWQKGVSMSSNKGSTEYRNIPDVALTADAVEVVYSNGLSGVFGGTSCAAPLWAGFCSLINEQSAGSGGNGAGFLNSAFYTIGTGNNYTNCFHDVVTGNNIGDNTAGLYYATNGYDLCTGLGTPNGTNLINTLAPLGTPFFITQPATQNVTNGAEAVFAAAASGAPPLGFQWFFNGANLTDGGNISGSASNVLTLAAAATGDVGNYTLVVTNAYGAITSSVAMLNIGVAPVISASPTNLIVATGSNAVFTATAGGSTPLTYQWLKNGTNLVDSTNIAGATDTTLTLTAVTAKSGGSYSLYVTNAYGAITSSPATLFVYVPPVIKSSTLTNQTVQCGSNNPVFTVTVFGEPAPVLQWSLDGVPVPDATNTVFSLTNLELPDHVVSLVVTNLYGSVTNSAVITVQDTLPPVITLYGANPLYIQLGGTFTDPGATATDLCVGAVSVSVSGTVNTNVVGTNTLTYSANDGNGNTATATRMVIVQDTTPPTILWSFTNLVLAAGTNCSAAMPNVTGTNSILATDIAEPLTFAQTPTNDAALALGTNTVVIAVTDAYGNTAYSTNTIVVEDETPPLILGQPQGQTNVIGATVNFSVVATACTPETYQWLYDDGILPGDTNSMLTLSNLTLAVAGNYAVVITAAGGSTTSSVASLGVTLFPASGTLSSSENPSGFRDTLTFTAAVIPTNATGTIQFYTNGTAFDLETLVTGQATSTNLSSLPRGTNLIAAVYSGDASDLPFTNLLSQVVTNHPPTAVPAFFTRAAGATLEIPVTNLTADWSDVDGDTVSLAGVSVSTNGVTVADDDGVLTYFDPNNVSDQFTCTITDGFGGTNYQIVNIAVVFPGINVAPGNNSGGGITLNLNGAPGQTYVLETTTNLVYPVVWLPLATNTLGTNGLWQFTDPQSSSFTQKFYRLEFWQ
jgi:subtilase family serine protease